MPHVGQGIGRHPHDKLSEPIGVVTLALIEQHLPRFGHFDGITHRRAKRLVHIRDVSKNG
jgi:hypothetical protein